MNTIIGIRYLVLGIREGLSRCASGQADLMCKIFDYKGLHAGSCKWL